MQFILSGGFAYVLFGLKTILSIILRDSFGFFISHWFLHKFLFIVKKKIFKYLDYTEKVKIPYTIDFDEF